MMATNVATAQTSVSEGLLQEDWITERRYLEMELLPPQRLLTLTQDPPETTRTPVCRARAPPEELSQ